ncbi:MAG: peptide chain release factor N(5)-glutamine methyltransferase [Patescibacteria group bacterium]
MSLHELDILLCHVLNKPKEFIYSHPNYPLTKQQNKILNQSIKRRLRGEPIAYILGEKEFYGLNFLVNKHVLIPRPDTETLIDVVLPQLKPHELVCDIGTGSGIIAITLKKHFPSGQLLATDISQPALTVAKINAKKHHTKIQFYTSDVLNHIPKKYLYKIDWLICNAPYLTKKEAAKKSLAYEPQVALTPTGSTISIIKNLLEQAPEYLSPHGKIVLEIGYNQTHTVKRFAKNIFPHSTITVHQDLGGFDRVVVIDKK